MKTKIYKLLISCLLVIGLSGCTILDTDYKIYEDGEYSYTMELLVYENIAGLQDFDLEEIYNFIADSYNLEKKVEIKEVEKEIEGIKYVGLAIERPKGLPEEGGPVKIEIDRVHCEILFTLNNPDIEELFFSFIPVGADNGAESAISNYENIGLTAEFSFEMPGKILSTSGGSIEGNTVRFDLIDNSLREIIIRSEYPGLTYLEIGLICGGSLLVIILAFFLYRHFKKRPKTKADETVTLDPSSLEEEKKALLNEFKDKAGTEKEDQITLHLPKENEHDQ